MSNTKHNCSNALTALRIMEILRETDANYPLTQKEIAEKF